MKARLNRIWRNMKNRCYNSKDWSHYKKYGAKGITVCEEWKNDFQAFYKWAVDNGYRNDLTLDRIDVTGNYTPENCRWSTILEQNNNRSCCRYLTYNGRTQTIAQWSRERGINYFTLLTRVDNGWSIERALGYEKV